MPLISPFIDLRMEALQDSSSLFHFRLTLAEQ